MSSTGECSEERELVQVRALPERGTEASVGVHQAVKAEEIAQTQRQETAHYGGELFFLFVS